MWKTPNNYLPMTMNLKNKDGEVREGGGFGWGGVEGWGEKADNCN